MKFVFVKGGDQGTFFKICNTDLKGNTTPSK